MMQSSGPQSKNAFRLPSGTIDTHFHLFGPESLFPYANGRSYTPEDASLDRYVALANKLGISRAVMVQPSVYGNDNSRLLSGMAASPIEMRGVVVVDPTVTDAELAALHDQGVRGIRINLVFKAGQGIATALQLAPRLRELGWHIQFLVDISTWPEAPEVVKRLGVPAVFDHIGHVPVQRSVKDRGFQNLMSLLRDGPAWVKLSGTYRMTERCDLPPYPDVRPFFDAAIAANPHRLLWGTDWPHSSIHVPMPDDAALADMTLDWIGSDNALRRLVFVENPQQLYSFAPAEIT